MKRIFLLLPLAAATALATGDFYEEPLPSLKVYLSYDRLPRKTATDIVREVQGVKPRAIKFPDEIRAVVNALKAGNKPASQLTKVESLLAAERERTDRRGGGLNSLLHDMRDLCAGGAEAAAAAAYLEWRVANGKSFGYAIERDVEEARADGERNEREPNHVDELQKLIAGAPDAIKPHFMYADAASAFRSGIDDEKPYQAIIEKFPQHPRAEAAAYMVGRCLARQSRAYQPDGGYANVEVKAAEAKAAFHNYLAKYPQGRFAGDVHGWLGGLERNANRPAEALQHFVRQFSIPGHPELAVSATIELERCFRLLHAQPALIAPALRDPGVVQAAVYFALNEIEPVDGNGEYESAEFVAKWRKELLPVIASALTEQEAAFKAAGLKARHVASLALAASGAGEPEKGLALLAAADNTPTDDLVFARAVCFQRARKPREAAETYASLQAQFPDSPLAQGATMRLALALVDDRRAGEAAVVLLKATAKKPAVEKAPAAGADAPEEAEEEYQFDEIPRDNPGVEPAAPGQMRQLLDTLLNFAPLEELTATANGEHTGDEARILIRQVIASRHLARERFTQAQPFVPPAEWNLAAARLAELTAAEKSARTPAEKADAAMKLGDAWAAARGKLLTVPLDTEEWRTRLLNYMATLAHARRLENAQALGLQGATVLDLENRDELRHAFNWWLAASDAEPKSPRAATAIWRALRAMRDIADVSPFTLDRAAARKWSGTSKALYERLQKEHPSSVEAKRLAVWWTFPEGKSEDGDWVSRSEATTLIEKVGIEDGGEQLRDPQRQTLISVLNPEVTADVGRARQRVADLAKWARQNFTSLSSQCVVNFFEDLEQFFRVEGLTPEMARRYMELRYDVLCSAAIGFGPVTVREGATKAGEPGTFRGDEALLADVRAAQADPAMKRIADFLAFLEIAVVANHWVAIPLDGSDKQGDKDGNDPTYWGRDYVLMEKLCRAWLEAYPKSPKREAALLLHCRALRHAMEPYVYWKLHTWPLAVRWEGEVKPVEIPRLPFNAKVWKAALDLYDREFPKGRYREDVLGHRADLAVRMKDWKRAIQITLEHANGRAHLQPTAKNRLRVIFSRLRYDEDRADVLAATRAVPGARGALQDMLSGEDSWGEQPLDWISEWLAEEVMQ